MKRKVSFTFIGLILFAHVGKSQDSEKDTLRTVVLNEIIAQGQRLFPKFENLSTTNQSLTDEQINETQPEKFMDKLVYLPGVLNAASPLGGPTIVIRGQEQDWVNLFFNGIPIRANMEGNIPMDNFFFTNSDISLEKGSSSLIYGANSGGNVIRVDSRPNFQRIFGVNVNSFWGNNGKQSYNVNVNGGIAGRLNCLGSINYYKRNSFRLSEYFDPVPSQEDINRNNSYQNNLELMGTLTYLVNENHIISLTGMYDNGDYGYPPSIVSPRYRQMTRFRHSVLGLRAVSNLDYDLKLESNIYYTSFRDTLVEFRDASYANLKKYSHWNDETFGGRIIVSKVVNGVHTFNFSVDAKQDIHFQDMYKIIATTKVNTVLSTLEYRTELFSRFLINSGLSYNFTKPIYTSSGEIPLRDLSAINCQLSCAYVLPDNLQMIHLGYSRTTIFPRIRDLFGNDLRAGYVPNPDLKEEMNNNLDFGINSSFVNNNLGVSFSLFYNPVRDLLVDVALTDTTSQTQNLNSAIFYGSEVMIKYAPNENVFATLSYTYLKATNNSGNRTSDYIAYRPEHFLRMFLSYTPVRYIGVNCSFVFCSRQYYDSSTRWLSIPDYTLLDVGLQSKPIDHATLWFKVNNLFDRNYFSVFDQPQPGREFRVGFSVDFVTD